MREFASAGPADLRENGAGIAPLAWLSWEVRGKSEKSLLHLWSENHNLTRRVLAITGHCEQRLALAVESAKPDRLDSCELQAAKYWRRVNRHLEQEDFLRYGFFPGTQLQPAPAVVY